MKSTRLATLLQLVLALGNFLNAGTHRGNAPGIQIESLVSLAEAKAPDNPRLTLMHILHQVVAEQHPELLKIAEELPSLASARCWRLIAGVSP